MPKVPARRRGADVATKGTNLQFADHHGTPPPPPDPPVVPPGNRGRSEPPPGYRGGTRILWERFQNRYGICFPSASRRETREAFESWLSSGSFPGCRLPHSGVCSRPLGGLPAQYGLVRHDDVSTYEIQVGMSRGSIGTKTNDYTLGWHPQSMSAAITGVIAWAAGTGTGYVAGTTQGGYCNDDMPEVSTSKFNRVRYGMANQSWTRYHLILQNCQDWAAAHS